MVPLLIWFDYSARLIKNNHLSLVSTGSAFKNPNAFIHHHDATSITMSTGIQMRWMRAQ